MLYAVKCMLHANATTSNWLRLARETAHEPELRTQSGLGKRVGRTQAQVSRYESGERIPRPATVARLEAALKVKAGTLFNPNGPTSEDWLNTYLRPADDAPSRGTPRA